MSKLNESEVRERAKHFAGLPTSLVLDLKQQQCIRDLLALIHEQDKVIGRLPVTADGVRVGPGSVVYRDFSDSNRWHIFGVGALQTEAWDTMSPVATFRNTPDGNKPGDLETIMFDIEHCYSTREAAEAARNRGPNASDT